MRALLLLLLLPLFADNFNDGVRGPEWVEGSGFYVQAPHYSPLVLVDESTGTLTFTHPGSLYWLANSYTSIAAYDVRDRRVSAKLTRQGATAWLAVGEDGEHASVTIQNGPSGTSLYFKTYYAGRYDEYDQLFVDDYGPDDLYVALRFNRRGVYCETSPDGVNWVSHGLIKGKLDFTSAAHIELGGGGFIQSPGTSTIDDFKIE